MQQPTQQLTQPPEAPYASPSGSSQAPTSGTIFAHDDALIGPPAPGLALERLLRVQAKMPAEWDDLHEEAAASRHELECSIAAASGVQSAVERAQQALSRAWERAGAASQESEESAELCLALGFPPPGMEASQVGAVDVSSIVVTHARPLKQVLSTISFAPAPNATGYRLHETKMLPNGEEYEDSSVSSYLPTFTRVRLAAGEHSFRIESRNASATALSEYFVFSVPKP